MKKRLKNKMVENYDQKVRAFCCLECIELDLKKRVSEIKRD